MAARTSKVTAPAWSSRSASARTIFAVVAPVVGGGAPVPSASVGQLRPFVDAAHAVARGDLAAAASAAAAGDPVVALRVSSIAAALRPGWAGAAADQASALTIAQAAGTPKDVLDLAPASATDVELRLKDYAPEHKALTWDRDEQAVDFRLRR